MHTGTLGVRAGTMSTTEFDDFYRTHRADAVRWATALIGSPEIGKLAIASRVCGPHRRIGGSAPISVVAGAAIAGFTPATRSTSVRPGMPR